MFNKIIRLLVANDIVFWFGHYLFILIISVYIIEQVPDASILYICILFSMYLFSRGALDIVSHSLYRRFTVNALVAFMVLGISIASSSYFILSISTSLIQLASAFGLMGIGAGLYNPARFEILRVLRSKASTEKEWEILDGVWMIGMGVAVVVGGLIELKYSYVHLFKVAGFTSLMSVVPLMYLLKKIKD